MSRTFSEYLSRKRDRVQPSASSSTSSSSSSSTSTNVTSTSTDVDKMSPNWSTLNSLTQGWKDQSKLPPPLSPKIPAVYRDVEQTLIPQLLSPTLPPRYLEDDEPLDVYSRKRRVSTSVQRADSVPTVSRERVPPLLPPVYPDNKHKKFKDDLKKEVKKESSEIKREDLVKQGEVKQAHTEEELSYNDLLNRSEKYMKLATDQKHIGDSFELKTPKEAVLHYIDSINLYLIGFYYEDMSREMVEKPPRPITWNSLMDLIKVVVGLCISKKIDVIPGLCLQIKSIVHEHIATVQETLIKNQNDQRKRNEMMLDFMKQKRISKRKLREADQFCSLFKIMEKYPKIIQKFQEHKVLKTADLKTELRLPITQGTTIPELIAYSIRVTKSWAKEQKISHNWAY